MSKHVGTYHYKEDCARTFPAPTEETLRTREIWECDCGKRYLTEQYADIGEPKRTPAGDPNWYWRYHWVEQKPTCTCDS
ncbi:hypothetical protein BX283_1773 [Streptomyces sp. TLI_146]|nr:hypothetical protein BX283_1773 [Streptomyces sp. TLI_146]